MIQKRKSQLLRVEFQLDKKRLVKKEHSKKAIKQINFIKIEVDRILEIKQKLRKIKHTLKPDVKNKKFLI